MKIDKSTLDTLLICKECPDSTDTCVRFKRLIFQFTDSLILKDSMEFYLTGYIGFRNKDSVEPLPLKLSSILQDTIIDLPFAFANVDWTRGEIRDFLKEVANGKCGDADYAYITLSTCIDTYPYNSKRYLSLIATAYDKNGNQIISIPLTKEKSPNPRPPYPPEG